MLAVAKALVRARIPVFAVVMGLSGVLGYQALQVGFDFSPRAMFLTSDPEIQYLADFRADFGDEDRFIYILLVAEDTIFRADHLATVRSLAEQAEKLDDIESAVAITEVPRLSGQPGEVQVRPFIDEIPSDPAELELLQTQALDYRFFRNRLISADAKATAIVLGMTGSLSDEAGRRPTIKAIQRLAQEHSGRGLQIHLNGLPVVQRAYAVIMQGDLARSVLLSVLAMLIALLLLFRNLLGTLVPLATVLLAMLWTVGLMALRDVDFNIINAVVPTLLMVIAVSDAIHLVSRYYEELAAGMPKLDAISASLKEVGVACLLTSFTAAIGFFSLVVARVDIIKELGRTAGYGILLAFVVIITLVPALLALLPQPKSTETAKVHNGIVPRYLRWNMRVVRDHPGVLLAIAVAFGAFMAIGALRMDTQSRLLEEIRPHNPLSLANAAQERALGGIMPIIIDIDTGVEDGAYDPALLRAQQVLIQELNADPAIGNAIGLSDLVIELNGILWDDRAVPDSARRIKRNMLFYENSDDSSLLDEITDFGRSKAPVQMTKRDTGSEHFWDWYRHMEGDPEAGTSGRLAEIFADTDAHVRVTGAHFIATRALSNIVQDLSRSLTLAFVLIFGAMTLLFRSARVGLVSVLPNLFPLLVVAGIMGWMQIPLRTSTVLIFTLGLGLAVNDTVHFMARFRAEQKLGGSLEEQLQRTLMSTGRALIFTSVILVLGFLSLLTSEFIGIFQMGVLGTAAILGALLGDLFLLPLLLLRFKV